MTVSIAVIEDNADNRLLLHAILDDAYRLRDYETGAEALEGMPGDVPDLALLDISLPGMNGLEVLRRMRLDARLAHVPVIALTAHAMRGQREHYLAAGFDDYVVKPILDENELLSAIHRCLGRGSGV